MKSLRNLFVIAFIGLMLCACQDTPAEVKQNMKEYGDNKQVKESEVTYCSVEQLKKSKMPEITDSSLKFPKKVDFSGIEGVEVLSLSTENNFLIEQNVEKYTTLFGVGKGKMKKQDDSEENEWGKCLDYNSERERIYLDMLENGGMAYMAGKMYDVPSNVVVNKYNKDREDISKVKVALSDGKTYLYKVCENIEEWMEKNMHVDGIKYKVSDVYVRKTKEAGNKENILSMCAEYEHKGIRFNNHTLPLSEEQDDYSDKKLTTFLAVELGVCNSKSPSFFSRNMNIRMNHTQPIDKVVDFESAVNIVKETMSGFGTFHITEIVPLYTLNLKENSESPGAKIEARPAYAFLVETQKQQSKNLGILKVNNYEHFFLVDMVTGELTTDLSIGRSG